MNIKIKKHLLLYKNYKLKCSIGKSGITSFKKEGDFATPKGTFKLGWLYYRKDRIRTPKCKIRTKVIKKNIKSRIPNTISFNGKGVHLFKIIDLRQ